MKRISDHSVIKIGIALLILIAATTVISAQSTSFTYQGKLSDNGAAMNSSCDIEFRLFDVASGGAALATQQKLNVQVTDGLFAVELDYGPAAFAGPTRYIEIAVKPSGGASFTTMSPRSAINSAPYAVKSLNAENAAQLGGISASSFVQTGDARLSDARPPTAGSPSYIQNSNSPQSSSNFNISGNGFAGGLLSATTVNALAGYNLGNQRVLGAPGLNNIFAGIGAGASNTTGSNNAFVGASAGQASVDSVSNSFFGASAGKSTVSNGFNSFFGAFAGELNNGVYNSFFGSNAGQATTVGSDNSFFGADAGLSSTGNGSSGNAFFGSRAGRANISGANNVYVGAGAGLSSASGESNTFVGASAGLQNTNGRDNAFFGVHAGYSNKGGTNNVSLGSFSDVGAEALTNATAIGSHSQVDQSNSLVLGGIAGINGGTDTNVGLGTTTPKAKLHIAANGGNILAGHAGCVSGFVGLGFASSLTCTNYSLLGNGTDTIINRPTGGAISFREGNNGQVTINPGGTLSINTLGSAGSTQLCRNAANQISTCSSSLRYKKDLKPFTGGLALVNRLNPITFRWKSDNMLDLGFGAEDVAKVQPLLVSKNEKGEVEGVKYDRISAVLVNAVKEQQSEIVSLRKQVSDQKDLIDGLKKLVCQDNAQAEICK